jgi:hypothetical protein
MFWLTLTLVEPVKVIPIGPDFSTSISGREIPREMPATVALVILSNGT